MKAYSKWIFILMHVFGLVCNRTGKVFKIYSFYLSCFKFDAALFNLHISCRVYLEMFLKPAKLFSFFFSKTDIFIFRYILGNA